MIRGSGILCHISSLPAPFGIGDLGSNAYKFVDFLKETGQSFLQILPLNPTESFYGNSPYHGISALAGNPLFISPEGLLNEGLISPADISDIPKFSEREVDFESVINFKKRVFDIAYNNFKVGCEFKAFVRRNSWWLEDFALFSALKRRFKDTSWGGWPKDLRDRNPSLIEAQKKELEQDILREEFLQFIFDKQWKDFKSYCNERGIHIIGDIPIYVDYDSVDVWTYPQIFKLDSNKKPIAVSGVPPDYFSSTGQLWGNPVYNWESMAENRFDFWIRRFKRMLELTDIIRIDHFRGLVAYWEVPYGEKTAMNGKWVDVPVYEFFDTLFHRFSKLAVIAEDLGVITPDVREVIRHYGFPGMKVLLFAFGDEDPHNLYLPHMYEKNSVVYTGTHDNNTALGWFETEANDREKKRFFSYVGRDVPHNLINREFIRLAMSSVSNIAIIPIQDVLGLDASSRMNTPARNTGNWQFRFTQDMLNDDIKMYLRDITHIYGR